MHSRHELTDVSAVGLMWVAIALIAACLIMLLILGSGFFLLKHWAEASVQETTPPNLILQRTVTPPPRLQINPSIETEGLLAKEKAILESYGWVDRQNGVVRIPIDRAIEILSNEH